jgi:hypothetical protein
VYYKGRSQAGQPLLSQFGTAAQPLPTHGAIGPSYRFGSVAAPAVFQGIINLAVTAPGYQGGAGAVWVLASDGIEFGPQPEEPSDEQHYTGFLSLGSGGAQASVPLYRH